MPPPGIDLPLLLTVLALVGFGLLMVYSSSFIFAQERTGDGFAFIKKQLLFSLSGVGLMAAICRLDYRKWATSVYPALGLATLLLALVMIPGLGFKAGGAQRWIRLGALSFQPGELAKFAVLLFVARQLDYKQARAGGQTAGILSSFLVPLPALILLLAQPDFGAAVMIVAVVLALMFVGGVPKKYLIAAILLGVIAAAWLALGSPYRRARVASFLDPWQDPAGKGFQIIQSLVGFHNGSFWGVGLGNGREKLFFLPEAHNDFIFAVIGEELGFIGVAAVLLAFVYFVYRGFKIGWTSYRHHGDRFGLYLAVGITLALGLQGFVNMAVAVGMLPTKGLNLPFISYGGSALLVDLCAVGILLSISRGPSRGRGWLHK
ncbi:MAG: cell division protein FtsW [Bdellovibrionales bacterium RIFOXYD1_FULL_53_11]|nr:MAG: cell division protein FtsW [Bdellovibrionales bacterium RIFOXYD1_FULL_53_11]